MTIVEGQIETLRTLKESLHNSGVTRFGSVGEINRFLNGYDEERRNLPSLIAKTLEAEIQDMKSSLANDQKSYDKLKANIRDELRQRAQTLESEIDRTDAKIKRNIIYKIIYFVKFKSLSNKRRYIEKHLDNIVEERTITARSHLLKIKHEIDYRKENSEKIVSERSKKSLQELDHAKKVIDGLYTLVAGAIGEHSVVKSLQTLPDDFYLINDYSVKCNPPIYNKKEKDKILSIQIDHLLISPSGVFLLETKNWSKSSLNNLDLRSPVKQILRTSFALFVLLNSSSSKSKLKLKSHHWGNKKVPIRNIIVMIHEKPKEEFKHVKVLALSELIGYIRYFDQIFDPEEVHQVFDYLKQRMQTST